MTMLRSINKLIGFSIAARDGEIGKIRDVYFDDSYWVVRYLVVDLGNWLTGRVVLLSPAALGPSGISTVAADLTKEQIRKSPDIDTTKPISRNQKEELHRFYAWPYYWDYDTSRHPDLSRMNLEPRKRLPTETEAESTGNTPDAAESGVHLQSIQDLKGFRLQHPDGHDGRIDDYLIDDTEWNIRYLVVDTGGLLSERKVLIAPQWIDRIDLATDSFVIEFPRDKVKGAPLYDPLRPITRAQELSIFSYFDKPHYWRD